MVAWRSRAPSGSAGHRIELVALRVQVLDLVPFAGEVVQSLLEQRVALYVPAGNGPAALR
jgi:hypothetical protein